MGISSTLAYMLGGLALLSPAAPETAPAAAEIAAPPPFQLNQCAPLDGADWLVSAGEPEPERQARRRKRLRPRRGLRTDQRPEDFWWPSPEQLLGVVYVVGNGCGPRECCKFCSKGKACGDSCISRSFTCRKGCGCACQRPLALGD